MVTEVIFWEGDKRNPRRSYLNRNMNQVREWESLAKIRGKNNLGIRNKKCKGPEPWTCWMSLKASMEASVVPSQLLCWWEARQPCWGPTRAESPGGFRPSLPSPLPARKPHTSSCSGLAREVLSFVWSGTRVSHSTLQWTQAFSRKG